METLLRNEFVAVVNANRRNNAPAWNTKAHVRVEDIGEAAFDVGDPKDDLQTIKRELGHGAASYINGTNAKPYHLRFVCYDEYLHQFVFDDELGHHNVSMLKDHTQMADFIVYDTGQHRVWMIIHELSTGALENKRGRGKLQLSATVNMLYKSPAVKKFMDGFKHKICILSAHDKRFLSPQGIADAFMTPYLVHPEPLEFNFGVIRRFGFRAFETSKVILNRDDN